MQRQNRESYGWRWHYGKLMRWKSSWNFNSVLFNRNSPQIFKAIEKRRVKLSVVIFYQVSVIKNWGYGNSRPLRKKAKNYSHKRWNLSNDGVRSMMLQMGPGNVNKIRAGTKVKLCLRAFTSRNNPPAEGSTSNPCSKFVEVMNSNTSTVWNPFFAWILYDLCTSAIRLGSWVLSPTKVLCALLWQPSSCSRLKRNNARSQTGLVGVCCHPYLFYDNHDGRLKKLGKRSDGFFSELQ